MGVFFCELGRSTIFITIPKKVLRNRYRDTMKLMKYLPKKLSKTLVSLKVHLTK